MGLEIYPRIAQAANAEAEGEKQRAELLAQQLEEFGDATERAQHVAQGRVATLEKVAKRVRTALPGLAKHSAAVTEARRACETLIAERDRLGEVAAPAGLDELGKREREIRAAVELVDEELTAAEAADTTAREHLAAAPPRASLEQAHRDRLELDGAERRLLTTQELQRRHATALIDVTAAGEEAERLALRARRAEEATARFHLAAALRPHLRAARRARYVSSGSPRCPAHWSRPTSKRPSRHGSGPTVTWSGYATSGRRCPGPSSRPPAS